MAWIEPVFDRTQDDITNRTDKGFVQAADLNRIEGNIAYVATKLGHTYAPQTWTQSEWPRVSDWQWYLDAVDLLRQYGVYTTTPDTPEMPVNTWQKMNALERIIYDINKLYDTNQEYKIYMGTGYYTGTGKGLL